MQSKLIVHQHRSLLLGLGIHLTYSRLYKSIKRLKLKNGEKGKYAMYELRDIKCYRDLDTKAFLVACLRHHSPHI